MPKVTINYVLEYKGRFKTGISDFEGLTEEGISYLIADIVKEDVSSNVSAHVTNMPEVIAEITEGLKLLAVQRAEEKIQ